MGTIEKAIADLKEAGLEVVTVEEVYALEGKRELTNIDGVKFDATGKMMIEIRCVAPITRA